MALLYFFTPLFRLDSLFVMGPLKLSCMVVPPMLLNNLLAILMYIVGLHHFNIFPSFGGIMHMHAT